MLKKILIANRGEIACRIIDTARKLKMKTVAVYSDVDARAKHVQDADEAICLGGTTSGESYLDIEKIIEAIKKSKADCVHPGYGFLSENPKFAKRLAKEKICFIGPGEKAIKAMGDKISSKALAQKAGVSTILGSMDLIENEKHAVEIAKKIGYPIMLKASAGGGGKGMRIAFNDTECRQGFLAAKNEAKNSFGDDRIFIEKFITSPRHIEIQILADKFGNCIYLGERECSIQRRNQKVIEEAPSSFVDEELRVKMGEQAVMLAKAVKYVGAGTVEFVVDENKNFYFLEMNTRLQVEHPITELITGLDLVEQMILIASGEKLKMQQQDIMLNGWAFEARIYAEDPYRNFLPSSGRITKYRVPSETKIKNTIIRNDTGVYEGGEISIHYDPMISKLCVWAETRESAILAMQQALDYFEIEGISCNIPFLSTIFENKRFINGELTTAFISQEYPNGFKGNEISKSTKNNIAEIAVVLDRIYGIQYESYVVYLNGEKFTPNDIKIEFTYVKGDSIFIANYKNYSPVFTLVVKLENTDFGYRFFYRGCTFDVRVFSPRLNELYKFMLPKQITDSSHLLLCPMPGLVVSLDVEQGEMVEQGQPLLVLEAMKMENIIFSPRKGKIAKINIKQGDKVELDKLLLEFVQ